MKFLGHNRQNLGRGLHPYIITTELTIFIIAVSLFIAINITEQNPYSKCKSVAVV